MLFRSLLPFFVTIMCSRPLADFSVSRDTMRGKRSANAMSTAYQIGEALSLASSKYVWPFLKANGSGDGGARLKEALRRIQREAEDGVRGGAVHVILSDRAMGRQADGSVLAPIPMILAAGGVHTHLVRQQLRTFTSLNVRSAECLDVHHFGVLIGVGATTVNAYLAEASIADRHEIGRASCRERV